MASDPYIPRYIHIRNEGILLDGELIYRPGGKAGIELLTDAYKVLEDIAVIVSCAHSSLDTDRRYWESVEAGAPSPSLFVYTLPNVMLGEICIRWGIKGENTCMVSDTFDVGCQADYVNGLLDQGYAEAMEELMKTLKVQIVEQLNLQQIRPEDIGDDQPLFIEGLALDSIDALELIVLLQQKYGIKLAKPEEGPQIFKTVRNIAQYITDNRPK
ncbi:unnamed protein product [Sphagnum balticum]